MSEQAPNPADLSAPRRRPTPTIDLTATEVRTEVPSDLAERVKTAADDAEAGREGAATEAAAQGEPSEHTADADSDAAAQAAAESPAAEAEAGAPEPPEGASPPERPVPRRRRGNGWSHLAAGALGAALVAAVLAGLWASGSIPRAKDDQAQANAARIAALEGEIRDLSARSREAAPPPAIGAQALQDLADRVAKLEAAPPGASAGAQPAPASRQDALAGRVDAAEAATKALAADIADLRRQTEATAGTAADAAKQAEAAARAAETAQQAAQASSTAAEAVQGTVQSAQGAAQAAQSAAQTAQSAAQSAQGAARSAQAAAQAAEGGPDRKDFAALASRVAALEQAGQRRQEALAAALHATRFAVAAVALHDAVDAGLPFAAELAAVRAHAGSEVDFASLEAFAATGIKRPMDFNRELADLGPAMLRIAQPQDQDGGSYLEKLEANAKRLVRIHRVEDEPSGDPAAIIGRIEARAVRMTVAEALAEVEKLPPAVRAPAADWIKQAQMRVAAIELSGRLETEALGSLARQTP